MGRGEHLREVELQFGSNQVNHGDRIEATGLRLGWAGDIWVSTAQNGIARNAPRLWQTPTYLRKIKEPVYDIQKQDGFYWLITQNNLVRYTKRAAEFYSLPPSFQSDRLLSIIPAIEVVSNGQLIVAGYRPRGIIDNLNPTSLIYPWMWKKNMGWKNLKEGLPIQSIALSHDQQELLVRSANN